VRDRRARRIDRFFKDNPPLANAYLNHEYFEVRAIAARYASVLRLPALLNDPEPEVRASAAMRLPEARISALIHDIEPRVRIALANRLEGAALLAMLHDEDYLVRLNVVRRLPSDLLPLAASDPDSEVRRWVAAASQLIALISCCLIRNPWFALSWRSGCRPNDWLYWSRTRIYASASPSRSARCPSFCGVSSMIQTNIFAPPPRPDWWN